MNPDLSPYGNCLACSRKDIPGAIHRIGTTQHPFSSTAPAVVDPAEKRVKPEVAHSLIAAMRQRRASLAVETPVVEIAPIADGRKPTWEEAKVATSVLTVEPEVVVYRLERIARLADRITRLERVLNLFSEDEIELRAQRYGLPSDFYKTGVRL